MINNILLVANNERELNVLLEKLRHRYNIYLARNVEEMREMIEFGSIQLIICNEEKPTINGWGICKALKSSLHYAHIPVILLTARNSVRAKINILESGVDAFVTKPIDPDYLHAQIINLIGNRAKIVAHFEHSLSAATDPLAIQEDNDFVKKLNDCIIDNIHKGALSVDYLARSMHMSRPTLYRKIKNITDRTPNELIGLARLKQAANLLLSANFKVFEVAQKVGFSSQSTFGKAFLKQFKVTPKEYQRMHKKS